MEKDLPAAVFTGHLEGENLARAIASSDIMIMPSVTEAFGNVVLEAIPDRPNWRFTSQNGPTGHG
jgi:glycosyltransferase involved in cell wall biosynthesis